MFKEERSDPRFSWDDIGDIKKGRPNLGDSCPVTMYRLLRFTIYDALAVEFDTKQAAKLFKKAGFIAGREFCKKLLNKNQQLQEFLAEIQSKFLEQQIGVVRIEEIEPKTLNLVLTVSEDLECSGLPLSEETICDYDEGLIAGIMSEYTGKLFDAKEIDCWASGKRVCRFKVYPL
ncbi:MAG: 4-vinyl reductase [Bacteriovoracaceae bacterium]|nr:4-vinyl reductase [Bacteriovoracaceae bacterium]